MGHCGSKAAAEAAAGKSAPKQLHQVLGAVQALKKAAIQARDAQVQQKLNLKKATKNALTVVKHYLANTRALSPANKARLSQCLFQVLEAMEQRQNAYKEELRMVNEVGRALHNMPHL
jgi:hypothetical protein